jgi:hypothetical protein
MTKRSLFITSVFFASALAAHAQDAAAGQVKVDVKEVKLEAQPTPQIQANNVVDKRWKPKTWLEVDTEFDIKLPRAEGGNEGTYPALEFKYHLMTSASKDGKRIMLEGAVTCVNIPAHEKCHALAFVSPATLKRALMKDNGGKADIMGFAVEVLAGGQVVAGKSNPAGKWWEDASKYQVMDGAVLGKDKTPFAPLWGDYDVAPQPK